jgi:small toxic protein TisB
VVQRCAPLSLLAAGREAVHGRSNHWPGRRRRRQAGISWQQAAERYVSLLCSLTTGDARMGGMDIIILILKLMVAVLQLLDAVLKQFR